MLFHAALALVLSRHSNSDDIVIGTAVANRTQKAVESLIGFFVNTLVLRLDTHQASLADYLNQVRAVNLDAQSHQDVPFEKLIEHLKRQAQYGLHAAVPNHVDDPRRLRVRASTPVQSG